MLFVFALPLILTSSSISSGDSPPEPPVVATADSTADSAVGLIPGHQRSSVPVPDSAAIRNAIGRGDLDQALELIREEIAGKPGPPREPRLRLIEARVLDRRGDSWDAAQVYRRLLDDPELGEKARQELLEVYVRRGQFSAADRLVDSAQDVDAPPIDATVRSRAYVRSFEGRYAEAARLTEPLASAGDEEAAMIRANALLALGDREGAEALYLRALDESKSPSVRQVAHFGLGQVARLQGGRAVRALQDENAAEIGDAPWAELDWGLALRSLGRREEARSRLLTVADTSPFFATSARLSLSRLEEEEGNVSDALDHLAQAIEGSFGDFLALTRQGDLLVQEGEEDAGVESFRAALAIFPEFPPAREKLNRLLAQRGRWEEALETNASSTDPWAMPGWTWDRALEGDLPYFPVSGDRDSMPASDPRRVVLALVHLRAGNTGAALGWSEGATGNEPALLAIRAEALELCGRKEDAELVWQSILDAGSDSPIVREHLARLAFDRDPELAGERFAKLFELYPYDVRARARMARLFADAERYEEALAAYDAIGDGGWLTPHERRRIRVERQDLEDLIAEKEAPSVPSIGEPAPSRGAAFPDEPDASEGTLPDRIGRERMDDR
ncbi:MAG: tetratricopeptide repeat protein [Gemmatimonadetes bacterium]|nr:tetratricopeptide repeat protein [Gemmatimonadota bacterium]